MVSTLCGSSGLKNGHVKLALVLIGTSLFLNVIYKPLPKNFEQPLKYSLICFGSELSAYFGKFLEYTGVIYTRLNLTRFQYHMAIGIFNIRDPNDFINVTDETLEHISLRIYRPMNNTGVFKSDSLLTPTIIFYHGGGYFLGSADVIEPITYLLAKYTNFLVIYVEFRLIPEHKFPAALDDCLLATKHLINNHKSYNIDLDNLILMGDSAGGNLATVISQQLIEKNIVKPKLQVLIYPILQFFDFTLPSYRLNLPQRILGNIDHENFKEFLHYFTGYEVDDTVFFNGHTSKLAKESQYSEFVNQKYLPDKFLVENESDRAIILNDTSNKYSQLADILLRKEVSPLLVDDEYLKSHTPEHTFLVTTELDILRDDGFIYAERLRKLGLNIHHRHFENLFHGVLGLLHGPLKFDASHVLMKTVCDSVLEIINY